MCAISETVYSHILIAILGGFGRLGNEPFLLTEVFAVKTPSLGLPGVQAQPGGARRRHLKHGGGRAASTETSKRYEIANS